MKKERSFSFLKPDIINRNLIGAVFSEIEKANFKIIACRMMSLSKEQSKLFYAEHKGKPFFDGLVSIMSNKPLIAFVVEKENCVADYRTLLGATNPAAAAQGTIRNKFGKSIDENSVHGSDSVDSAKREIAIFFPELSDF